MTRPASVRCAGTPNGWGGNYIWPHPADQLVRMPCGWEGTDDQAKYNGKACPHCGGRVEPVPDANHQREGVMPTPGPAPSTPAPPRKELE